MQSYVLHSLFDLTKTGVIRGYAPNVLGLTDQAGQLVATEKDWNRSRNQQRNWETIIQLLSLRTQPEIRPPVKLLNQSITQFRFDRGYGSYVSVWEVHFFIEPSEVFKLGNNDVALLEEDFNRIPMISQLTETITIAPAYLITDQAARNITFSKLSC